MNKNNTMKYVTVLDFCSGRVHMYTVVGSSKGDWKPDEQSIEEFLTDVGHSVNNCEWMVHSDKRVVTSIMLTKENSFTK